MTDTIGLFVHYRPVVLALPTGGCGAVANFLGFNNPERLQVALDDAGLLFRHPDFGDIATRLLSIELAESTLGGVLHQSLMRIQSLTKDPRYFAGIWKPVFQWSRLAYGFKLAMRRNS